MITYIILYGSTIRKCKKNVTKHNLSSRKIRVQQNLSGGSEFTTKKIKRNTLNCVRIDTNRNKKCLVDKKSFGIPLY